MKSQKKLILWIILTTVLLLAIAGGGVIYYVWSQIIMPCPVGCIATQTLVRPKYEKDKPLKATPPFTLYHNGKKVNFVAFDSGYTCLRWKETSEFVLVTKEGSLRILLTPKAPRVEPYFAIDPIAHKVILSDGLNILKEEWTAKK